MLEQAVDDDERYEAEQGRGGWAEGFEGETEAALCDSERCCEYESGCNGEYFTFVAWVDFGEGNAGRCAEEKEVKCEVYYPGVHAPDLLE